MRRITDRTFFLAAFSMLLLACSPCNAGSLYTTNGMCDGYPRLNLKTPEGLCIGIVAAKLGFARGVAVLGSDIYVTDLGGWGKGRGRLLRLHGNDKPQILLAHIDEPNTILAAPNGTLYISLLGKIIQYDPATGAQKDLVINLPANGRHPLSAFTIAPDGSLFINSGSASDHCEQSDDSPPTPNVPCPESAAKQPRAILLHTSLSNTPIDAATLTPYARGLRNSMALAVEGGALYAAVNARDALDLADPRLSDEDLPHDLFVKVKENADYGWPYCYDGTVASPEYPHFDCSTRQAPDSMIPAHAAPLGMVFYKGDALKKLQGRLIVGYHGYRANGHRIMAFKVDRQGSLQSPIEIVGDWGSVPGKHPQGAPVSLVQAEDGSILITEDHNGTLLRLSHE